MTVSENKNGFTMVDHTTYDVVLPLLSTTAQSVFMRIYRQTIGWDKTTDKIADSQFMKKCNIKRRETINSAIRDLVKLDLITVNGQGKGVIKEYGIKWDAIREIKDRYDDGEFEA